MRSKQGFQFQGNREAGRREAQRLIAAHDSVEDALEAVDLDRDPAVADVLIDALPASDRGNRVALSED